MIPETTVNFEADPDQLAQAVDDAERRAAFALARAARTAAAAGDAEDAYSTAKEWQWQAMRECPPVRAMAKRTMLDAADRYREARDVAVAAQERSEALTHYARLLRRYCSLQALMELRREHGDELDRLIRPALAIVRPHFRAGTQVPLGEILLDARWGVRGRLQGPAPRCPALAHSLYRYTRWIAAPGFEEAVAPLYGYPMHLHGPLMAAVLLTIQLEHGRVRMVEPDLDPYLGDTDALRTVTKLRLHEAETAARPPVDEDDETEGRYGWNGRTIAIAESEGYVTHPDAMSRLSDWLPRELARQPWWWPRTCPDVADGSETHAARRRD